MKNNSSRAEALAQLKTQLQTLEQGPDRRVRPRPTAPAPEGFGELATGVVHDLYATRPSDSAALGGFGLGLAMRAAKTRPIVWAMDEMTASETGQPYGPGLHEMGLKVRDLILVRVRDAASLLAVGEEALHSPAVGAVILSQWGEAKAMSLTASRRLALAAQTTGSTLFLARTGADPAPSAAETRWSVAAAPSRALEANSPGPCAFSVTLLRHRHGDAPRSWILEWDRERRSFVEPTSKPQTVSGRLVSLVAERAAEPGTERHGHSHAA